MTTDAERAERAEAALEEARDALYWVTNYAPMGHHMAATDEEWHRVLRHARSLAAKPEKWKP